MLRERKPLGGLANFKEYRRTMKSMTFIELDSLEKETNKNKSKNLIGLVTPSEKVIICLGENKKVLWSDLVNFFVLTDYRLLANLMGFTNVMLDKIVNVKNRRTLDGHQVYIGLSENSVETEGGAAFTENGISYHLVYWTKDKDDAYIKWLTDELNKSISEAKIRLRSSTVNVKIAQQDVNDIAGQLERLASLYNSGAITQSEYNKAKEKLLST
jgi:hypothetical protein